MILPPELPVDTALENVRGIDAILRVVWKNGAISRLTTAIIGVRVPADAVETDEGAFYVGFPGLGQIPALKQVINGLSDSVTFSMSGLSGELAEMFDAEAGLSEGSKVYVGKVHYDHRMRIVAIRWLWRGEGGEFSLRRSGGGLSEGQIAPSTRTVTLEVATQQITRAGAFLYHWDDPSQQELHPGDKGCERTNLLSLGKNKAWPVF
ncbi:hypothetical protein [Methylopila sp. M107]|uniref:hypothetical protein n=1 Tax=Methylopila sp. M107 TaxID=1101190 RepID=UPI00037EDBC2|nr:hypothetical protein [Methylopila sp. M107]